MRKMWEQQKLFNFLISNSWKVTSLGYCVSIDRVTDHSVIKVFSSARDLGCDRKKTWRMHQRRSLFFFFFLITFLRGSTWKPWLVCAADLQQLTVPFARPCSSFFFPSNFKSIVFCDFYSPILRNDPTILYFLGYKIN